jgi:deoxyribodipyrimidine photolyase-related protein
MLVMALAWLFESCEQFAIKVVSEMMEKTAFLIFPHQLFHDTSLLSGKSVWITEEFLFFRQYNFHKQKLAFHRASMKAYEQYLRGHQIDTAYIETTDSRNDIRLLLGHLKASGFSEVEWYDTCDNWLEKRIAESLSENGLKGTRHRSLLFFNDESDVISYKPGTRKFYQTEYYIQQRKTRNVLLASDDRPVGGKWSFDAENRKKYPAGKSAPKTSFCRPNEYHAEAAIYIERHFSDHPGELNMDMLYPVVHDEAMVWLDTFLATRFESFGEYEDALVAREYILHHSVLSPLMNVGLILPQTVVERAVEYARNHEIPLNSLEGFVRQILGWREFIRLVYVRKGSFQRTRNFWGFKRKIPRAFYTGDTGILPVDQTIRKLLKTGYNHHIERLMVLSNFMLLCEFDPDEVYRWFMEMYIDAYDWVMVPNVYGMGQFADGGLMCTKPYISGSNYLLKMSDYQKGDEWTGIWDALFWRFMHVHRDYFLSNPRLGLLIKTFDKWSAEKRNHILKTADDYLNKL